MPIEWIRDQPTPAELDEGRFIRHTNCNECGSSDAKAIYDNGDRGYATYCFKCTSYSKELASETAAAEHIQTKASPKQKGLLQGEVKQISSRGLSQDTCYKYKYEIAMHNGEPVQVANYYNTTGQLVAQKVRSKDKSFKILGDGKKLPLFGSQRWASGSRLVITEGEIDCLSIAQVMPKTPIVSLPQGAQGAVKAIKDNWEYVTQFKEVILCFDMDDPGREAAQAVSELLPIGTAKIAHLPLKDANECLIQGKQRDIVSAIFEAKTYRPDGIVAAADIRQALSVVDAASAISYPYDRLNEITLGLRKGELVTVTAGSGIGKSTLVRELAYHLHIGSNRVGMIMLEESNKRTVLGMLGIHLNKNITVDRSMVEEADLYNAFDQVFSSQQIYMYDHFGSTEVETILQRIRYMVKALDVEWIILDHISILISGLAVADERKAIDIAMTALRTLISELGIGMIMVSHLKRPEGNAGHEDGQKVRLGQLRGSHSIAQLSDICIGLQVDPDEPDGDSRLLQVLKNRFTGETGFAGRVKYSRDSGRLLSVADTF